jgi:uncharacterized protein YegJ (DUF2314 family)
MNPSHGRDVQSPAMAGDNGARRVMTIMLAAIGILGAVAVVPSASVRAEDHSPIVDVPTSDPIISAAIAEARAALPEFWASYENPKASEGGHSLKVRFPTRGTNSEHIWMADVKKLGEGHYSGGFANAPRDLPGRREGDLVEFTAASISDWMFLRDGKIVGGETIRPLLKSLPKRDADALRARLERR